MSSERTKPSKEAFERFVKVQRSGIMNMLSPQVRDHADITREEHLYILENYEALEKEYGVSA